MDMSLILAVVKIAVVIGGILTAAAYFVLLERRVAAWVQDRRGPNRVGIPLTKIRLFGLGQPLADGAKMILKEEYTPAHVDYRLFVLAPMVIMTAALAVYAAIPFGSVLPPIPSLGLEQPTTLVVAPDLDVALIYIFALSSIAVYGVILGGWASNNKYSFLGGLRSSAQMIAYELPLGLGILGVVLASSSLKVNDIVTAQAEHGWYVLMQPLGFVVFIVAAFAEAGRLPFDLPEAEQELVAGFHTEYSGMKFAMFYMGEYISMIVISAVAATLYLGGWRGPFVDALPILGPIYLIIKIILILFFFVWVRATLPRVRYDRLMSIGWKILLPLSVLNVALTAIGIVAADTNFFGLLG